MYNNSRRFRLTLRHSKVIHIRTEYRHRLPSTIKAKSRYPNPAFLMFDSYELSDNDLRILQPLVKFVRVLTLAQIEEYILKQRPMQEESIEARILALQEAEFLSTYTAMVHPELDLQGPICSYHPGGLSPNMRDVARETRGRWRQAPVATDIVYATTHAKQELGGYLGGKKPRPSETRHDIHVSQIYLKLAATNPGLAATWIHEERLREHPEFVEGSRPDALVTAEEFVIIEFGGAYPRHKLEAFHVEQQERHYEIW